MPKKIVVDPFYDGAGDAIGATEIAGADLERMIPPGPAGLSGTVIPRAAEGTGGEQVGWKEAGYAATEVHVDPDIPGQSTVVKVEDLYNAALTEAAIEETAHVDPRIRASAVYNALASNSAEPSMKAANTVSPLKAFNATPTENAPIETAQAPAEPRPSAPTTWVTFEIEGFGEHRAPYHRVIRSNSNLVLVYDTKCDGTQRFFPRTTDQPLGIHIAGEPIAYYAHTTGIEFSDAGVDYCVLLVEHEAPLSAGLDNEME